MNSTLPKVLHKISGFEMLYYSIIEAKKISKDIHVVLFHQEQLIKDTMRLYFDDISYVTQDHLRYPGTGGALMNIDLKYENTLVLNGDMPLIQSEYLKNFISNDNSITMSVLNLNDASGYGRVLEQNNNVKKIIEEKDCNENELKIKTANAGVYCFKTKFLTDNLYKLNNNNSQKEYYITDLVEIAINNNQKVTSLLVDEDSFKGVNTKYDLANAEVIHQHRIKKSFMLKGVIMRMPESIYIENSVQIEEESILENNVTLLGESIIKNSHIKSNSIIENAVIEDSRVGPMARIRPNTFMHDTHVGNFVEIKKSKLKSVKIGHLSYIGDSFIDEGTNIGAGTITCNYDGLNKHKTNIGKNVFIGSGTNLIAPISLEDDCIVGAGSTISKDIKKGQLVLTRSALKIYKNYFYKFFGIKK